MIRVRKIERGSERERESKIRKRERNGVRETEKESDGELQQKENEERVGERSKIRKIE